MGVGLDGWDGTLTGVPGECDAGGRFSGLLLGREVICGTLTLDDGSSYYYYVVWSEPGAQVIAAVSDPDPARAWLWFTSYDPIV